MKTLDMLSADASAGIPCWCSRLAREGRYNLDPDIKFFATPPHHGSLAEVRRKDM